MSFITQPNSMSRGAPVDTARASKPQTPDARDVAAATTALNQKMSGSSATGASQLTALAAALRQIQQEDAQISQQDAQIRQQALADAAVLYELEHGGNKGDANVTSLQEAQSNVALTHRFSNATLDAAGTALEGGALGSAAGSCGQKPVRLGKARATIQTVLQQAQQGGAVSWHDAMNLAINAARVQFGGLDSNDPTLNEAALSVEIDHVASTGGAPASGDIAPYASRALAGMDQFSASSNAAALKALDIPLPLQAARIVAAVQAARGSGNAAGNLRAAQVLTQQLQGVASSSPLYQQVMADKRMGDLQGGIVRDITGAKGSNAQQTLMAEGKALSSYRNTPFYAQLQKATLASPVTRGNLRALGSGNQIDVNDDGSTLNGVMDALSSIYSASPALGVALYQQWQGAIVGLIGSPGNPPMMSAAMQSGLYDAPVAAIIDQVGGPDSAAAQPLMAALKTYLTKQSGPQQDNEASPLSGIAGLESTHQPVDVFQALVNQDPGGKLSQAIQQYSDLKPTSAAQDPVNAGTASNAQAALDEQLSGGAVTASSLQGAVAAGKKANPQISQQSWAQAEIVEQAGADEQLIEAGSMKAPANLIQYASGQVGGDQVADATVLDQATQSLEHGTVRPGGNSASLAVQEKMPAGQTQADATGYMSGYLQAGATPTEALELTDVYLGGSQQSESLLAQAAISTFGEAGMSKYDADPTTDNPLEDAAAQLRQTGYVPSSVVDAVMNGTAGQPGMDAQQVRPDSRKLATLIGQSETDRQNWQTAQAYAKAHPDDAAAQQKAAAALQTYNASAAPALNAAAGIGSDNYQWQTNPADAVQLSEAQYQLVSAAVRPLADAASGTATDSPENQALNTTATQWQTLLEAQQAIAQVQLSGQGNNVAALRQLSTEIGSLPDTDPVYQQVMGDARIQLIVATAQGPITSAAAAPKGKKADSASAPSDKLPASPFLSSDKLPGSPFAPGDKSADSTAARMTRYSQLGKRLNAYNGTMLYKQLVDDTLGNADVKTLFGAISTDTLGQASDDARLTTLANFVEGGPADLNAALLREKFSDTRLLDWAKNANDLAQLARIYAACGGSQNPQMVALRRGIEAMLAGDPDFGSTSTGSTINVRYVATGKDSETRYGQDFGFDILKKNDVPLQLAQDMIDDRPASATQAADAREIARETGLSALGAPAAPARLSGPGNNATDWASGSPVSLTANGHLVGLQQEDGMTTLTSRDQVLNAVGEAEEITPTRQPQTLAQEQEMSMGQFALYTGNEIVYDQDGRRTTLNQIAQSLMTGEGVSTPGALAPVTETSLSLQWWKNSQPTGNGQQLAVIEGIGAKGDQIDIGPASTRVADGYANWVSDTGLASGSYFMGTPHWVLNAQGVQQTGSAYMTSGIAGNHWYDWDHIKTDLDIAGTVVAGLLTTLVQPETAALWVVVLSDIADMYFAASATVGAVQSMHMLTTDDGWKNGWNWLGLDANVLGGVAGMGGVAGRTATLMERVGVTDKAFADALDIVRVSGEARAARVSAAIGDVRPVQQFRHTLGELVLRRMAVGTPEAAARGARFVRAVQHLTGTWAYRAIGVGAMATNFVSMAHQGAQLIEAGSNASGSDRVQLLTLAGLMAVGYGAVAHGQDASPEHTSSEGVRVVGSVEPSGYSRTKAGLFVPDVRLLAAPETPTAAGGDPGGKDADGEAPQALEPFEGNLAAPSRTGAISGGQPSDVSDDMRSGDPVIIRRIMGALVDHDPASAQSSLSQELESTSPTVDSVAAIKAVDAALRPKSTAALLPKRAHASATPQAKPSVLTEAQLEDNRRMASAILGRIVSPFGRNALVIPNLVDQCCRSSTLMAMLQSADRNGMRIINSTFEPLLLLSSDQSDQTASAPTSGVWGPLAFHEKNQSFSGTFYDPRANVIALDAFVVRANLVSHAGVLPSTEEASTEDIAVKLRLMLIHELAHSLKDKPVLFYQQTGPDDPMPADFTNQARFTRAFETAWLYDEGNSVMFEHLVDTEISANGGRSAPASEPSYRGIFYRFQRGTIDWAEAAHWMGRRFGDETPNTDPKLTYIQMVRNEAARLWNVGSVGGMQRMIEINPMLDALDDSSLPQYAEQQRHDGQTDTLTRYASEFEGAGGTREGVLVEANQHSRRGVSVQSRTLAQVDEQEFSPDADLFGRPSGMIVTTVDANLHAAAIDDRLLPSATEFDTATDAAGTQEATGPSITMSWPVASAAEPIDLDAHFVYESVNGMGEGPLLEIERLAGLSPEAAVNRSDTAEPANRSNQPDSFDQMGVDLNALIGKTAWLTLVRVAPSADRRSVRVTTADGDIVNAQMMGGGRGPVPTHPDDILLPGQPDGGQRFELMVDADAGKLVIMRQIRGGAVDKKPWAAATRTEGGATSERSVAEVLRLARPKARPGERDQMFISSLPVVEDPTAVLYLPRRSKGGKGRVLAPDDPAGEQINLAPNPAVREPISRSPERTGPFQTGFPIKKSEYPLRPWMARYVPETGLIYTEARQVDLQWVFRPYHERRDATSIIMIAPDVHVVSALGTPDALFDLNGRPITAIMDLRRRLVTPQRLANRLSENFGLDERSYTPGQPIAVLAEYTAAGGRHSFAQQLANEMHAPVYGLEGSYEDRQWLLCFPDTISHPAWQPDVTGGRSLPDGGLPMRVKWNLLERRASSELEVLPHDNPVKIDTYLAPQGMFVVNGQTDELIGRGAASVAASARAAGHTPGKPVLLLTTEPDVVGQPFAGELADELQSPVLIMTDAAWSPGGSAVRKNTVIVSRVEGAQNRRITIDEEGNVKFLHTQQDRGGVVWLNLGPMERSLAYFEQKRGTIDDVVLHTFEVPRSVLEEMRRNAVRQSKAQAPGNEDKPVLGDWRASPDQFGLRWDDAVRLEQQVIRGSAKTTVVPIRDGTVRARLKSSQPGAAAATEGAKLGGAPSQIHPRPDEFGRAVTIESPTQPSDISTWDDATCTAVFVPDGAHPDALHGIGMMPWEPPTTPEGWQDVPGQNQDLVEPETTASVKKAGVVIMEPDGRMWIIESTNRYAGARTFAKGSVEDGLSLQATAIKEAYEGTGLQVQIDAFLMDFKTNKSSTTTRYYLARRVGGSPSAMGWETQGVYLVPRELMGETLRTARDKRVLGALSRYEKGDAPSAGALAVFEFTSTTAPQDVALATQVGPAETGNVVPAGEPSKAEGSTGGRVPLVDAALLERKFSALDASLRVMREGQPFDTTTIYFADDLLLAKTPHEFMLTNRFYNWWSGEFPDAIALYFTNPSETTRERGQQIANIAGTPVLVPRIDAPTEWRVLRPQPMALPPGGWPSFDQADGQFYVTNDDGTRLQVPPEEYLSGFHGAGDNHTAFNCGPSQVVVVNRNKGTINATQERIDLTATVASLEAPHLAKILGTTLIHGHDAFVMESYPASDRSLKMRSSFGSSLGYVVDDSLLNAESVNSLRTTRSWMKDNDVQFTDLQFLVRSRGTFDLADLAGIRRGDDALMRENFKLIDWYIKLAESAQALRSRALSAEAPPEGEPDIGTADVV